MAPLNVNGLAIESAPRLCVLPANVNEPCSACAWSSDGSYFAWLTDQRTVKIFGHKCLDALRRGVPVVDEHTLTIRTNGVIHSMEFCQIKNQNSRRRRSCGSLPYLRVVTHDVLLVTGHRNGRIRAWDAATGLGVRLSSCRLMDGDRQTQTMARWHVGRHVVLCVGVLKLELCDHIATVSCLSFCPGNSTLLVSASMDGTLKLWDLADDGNMIKTLRTNCTTFYGCRWSPDGNSLATVGNYHSVHLWDMKSWLVRHRLNGHRNTVTCCDFSPDGALLATASHDSRVIIWDTHSADALFFLEHVSPPLSPIFAGGVNGSYVRFVSFSHDGRHIATVCDDGYVRFWDAFNSDDCIVQAAQVDEGLVCNYSPDGAILAVGSSSGEMSLWVSPMCLPSLQQLCRMTIRRLLNTDKVDSLLCMPPPIRRYLQYVPQPISACC